MIVTLPAVWKENIFLLILIMVKVAPCTVSSMKSLTLHVLVPSISCKHNSRIKDLWNCVTYFFKGTVPTKYPSQSCIFWKLTERHIWNDLGDYFFGPAVDWSRDRDLRSWRNNVEQVEAGPDLRRPEGARHLSQVDGILFIGWGPRKRRNSCHKTHDIWWAMLPLNLVVSKTQLE